MPFKPTKSNLPDVVLREEYNEYEKQLNQSISLIDFISYYEGSNAYKKGGYLRLHDDRSAYGFIDTETFKDYGRTGAQTNGATWYLQKYKGMSKKEAIDIVESVANFTYIPNQEYKPREQPKYQEKGEFKLPPPATKSDGTPFNDNIIKYLTEERKINKKIVLDLIAKGKIYETHHAIKAKTDPVTGKKIQPPTGEVVKIKPPSIVFVGEPNQEGKPTFACTRSLAKDGFRGDVLNSDKSYNFTIMANPPYGKSPTSVAIFEAPIDALSAATIGEMQGETNKTYGTVHFLSLSGVSSSKALKTFLANNPQVKDIEICLDNDVAGQGAARKIAMETLELGKKMGIDYNVKIITPEIGKDFNDILHYLVDKKQKTQENSPKSPACRTGRQQKKTIVTRTSFEKPQQRKAKPKNNER